MRDLEVLQTIATMRAVRRYRPVDIPDDDLARMFYVATRAPSGSNLQPFRFVVLRDDPVSRQARELLQTSYQDQWPKSAAAAFIAGAASGGSARARRLQATMQSYVDGLANVPLIVLAGMVTTRPPRFVDGASLFPACQNLMLAARVLGYGGVLTQWHGPVQDDLSRVLGLPADAVIAAVMTFGVPVGSHGPVRRRPVGSVVYEGGWGIAPTWAADDCIDLDPLSASADPTGGRP